MNPSERIRAALLKSEATRQTAAPPTLDPPAEVETTLPLVTASDEDRAALSGHEAPVRLPRREKTKPIQTSPPPVAAKKEPTSSRSRRTPLILGAVVVVVGLTAYLLRDRWLPIHTAAKPALTARVLQMDVETAGVGLVKVRWNPQSVPVTQAREGRLVVSEDNQQPRTVPLALEQLKIGHLDYQSAAQRIEFRLEVVDRSGALAKESVMALTSKPASTPADIAPSQPAPQQAAPPPVEQAKVNPPQVEKAPDPPQPSRPAPREFTPPPAAQRPTEDVRTVVLDAPASVPVASIVKPVSGLPDRMPSVPAPQVQPSTGMPSPPVGGNLQEPKLQKKVAPTYPSLARSLRIEGSVRFTATIRKDGTVQNVQLVSGHKMLVQAATDAVRQWIYRPAVLNGKPVEVTTQIDVKFTLNE